MYSRSGSFAHATYESLTGIPLTRTEKPRKPGTNIVVYADGVIRIRAASA